MPKKPVNKAAKKAYKKADKKAAAKQNKKDISLSKALTAERLKNKKNKPM